MCSSTKPIFYETCESRRGGLFPSSFSQGASWRLFGDICYLIVGRLTRRERRAKTAISVPGRPRTGTFASHILLAISIGLGPRIELVREMVMIMSREGRKKATTTARREQKRRMVEPGNKRRPLGKSPWADAYPAPLRPPRVPPLAPDFLTHPDLSWAAGRGLCCGSSWPDRAIRTGQTVLLFWETQGYTRDRCRYREQSSPVTCGVPLIFLIQGNPCTHVSCSCFFLVLHYF